MASAAKRTSAPAHSDESDGNDSLDEKHSVGMKKKTKASKKKRRRKNSCVRIWLTDFF
jgi:hypothetical protein